MKSLKAVINGLGRAAYYVSFVGIWFYLRRTSRVYVLLICGTEVLVVKNWLSDGKWHLPGGGVKGTESPQDAVLRELKEEVGINNARNFRLIADGTWHTNRLGNRYKIFAASVANKQIRPKWPEITNAQWLNTSQLSSANTPSEILGAVAAAQSENLLQ